MAADTCLLCETFGNTVQGDARIAFELSPDVPLFNIEPGTPLVVVAFTNLYDLNAGTRRSDIRWDGLRVHEDSFGSGERIFADSYISGRFYGPNHEEVGGVLERGGIAGAFGGSQ